MKKLFFALAAFCGLLALGCPDPGTSPADVDLTANFTGLTADGSATQTTTKLSLTFDQDITGLTAGDITLGGSTGAVAGTLTRTGTGTYDLAISGITQGGTVTVMVAKSGYNITGGPKSVTVNYYSSTGDTPAAFTNLTANGSATETTTKLSLTFNPDIPGLAVENISLGGSTGATAGTLTSAGSGTYDLAISGITQGGTVTVTVAKQGYAITGSPQTVTVNYYSSTGDTPAGFTSLTANGSATETTTKLTLTFNPDIPGLAVGDITLEPGSTGATAGTLTSAGAGTYDLTVSGITQGGEVTVTVAKPGYNITGSPQTVTVNYYSSTGDTPATFTTLTADGSATATTTKLSLTFDQDIPGLTAGDITLGGSTGATAGTLTRTATGTYDLAISGITQGGEVTVTVAKPGYNITGSPQTVTVNYYSSTGDTPATFTGLTANGSATQTTTKLTLTFDQDIPGLTAGDITLGGSTGATAGTLTSAGNGTYDLAISGITQGGEVTVTVAKQGYNITGSPQTVTVNYYSSTGDTPAAFTNLTANGSATETTTKLSLTFNPDIPGLAVENISLGGSTGATPGTLTSTGTGTYDLAISGITQGGEVTVTVTKQGYAITGSPRTAQVFYFDPGSGDGNLTLTLTFAQIADAAPEITGPTLHLISGNGPTTATLTVENPDQYTSISWRVQTTDATGTGDSFTLDAANFAYNQIAEHFVTVTVMKGTVPYNKTVSFKIER